MCDGDRSIHVRRVFWFFLAKCKHLLPKKKELHYDRAILKDIFQLSSLTCVQQSVMNFGILMVQGLVNSFGATVMAAFAAAVKIDTFAHSPVQDFRQRVFTLHRPELRRRKPDHRRGTARPSC